MQEERFRPEDTGDASLYYDSNESKRYHTCNDVVQKQLELTARALEFLGLLDQQTEAGSSMPLIADIGCGSGLSGALLSQLQLPWIGLDVSSNMLQIAAQQEQQQSSSSSTPLGCCGLLTVDMAQGLPLRPASLDGAISISALQWIIEQQQQQQEATSQVETDADAENGLCVMQPLTNQETAAVHQCQQQQQQHQAAMQQQQQQQRAASTVWPAQMGTGRGDSSSSSSSNGVQPHCQARLLTFFSSLAVSLAPGSSAVVQFYPRSPAEAQAVLASAAAAGLIPLLLVDFPHRTQARKYFLQLSSPVDSTAAAAACTAAAAAPACPLSWHIGGTCSFWHKQQQQQQDEHHLQRQSQQQQQQQPLKRIVCGVDTWAMNFHLKHTKKLLRLMWRAALDSSLVSINTDSTLQVTRDVTFQVTQEAESSHAAAFAAAPQDASRTWLKVVLQLDLPPVLHAGSGSSQVGSSSSSSEEVQEASRAAAVIHRQLNCYGNTLILWVVGNTTDLVTAAAAAAGVVMSGATAATAAAAVGQETPDASAAVHSIAKQLASAIETALEQQLQHLPQQMQQQQSMQVQTLSAEWLSQADLTPQQPAPQQQQGKRAHRARKQLMQAALLPLLLRSSSVQQQQQQQADTEWSRWMKLDAAVGFAPHIVYMTTLHNWTAMPPLQQQQQQHQHGSSQHSSSSSSSGVAGLVDALLHGVSSVQAAQPCLGVYAALLVVHSKGHPLQLLLGCYGHHQ